MRPLGKYLIFTAIYICCISCNSTTETGKLTVENITNLIGYWTLNGNANDNSLNQNHGDVNGAILGEDRFENVNSAYYFDGIDDYITIKEANGFVDFDDPETAFTFSAWFIITENISGFIFSNTSEDGWLDLRLSNGVPRFGIRDSDWTGTVIQSDSPITINEWHHIVGVFNNPVLTLYIDGVVAKIGNFVGEILTFGGLQGGGIRIGAYYLPDGYLFKGGIDDVRVYNRNLTEEEVMLLYNEKY